MGLTQRTSTLKKRLLDSLERVPETDIQEILDFVDFIVTKRYKKKPTPQKTELDPAKDPALKLIGIADVKSFSKEIDRELYGS